MTAPKSTYYDVLGIPATATLDEIRRRYRQLARELHPDVAASEEAGQRFRLVNEAHRVLSNPERRKTYDAELKLAAVRQAVRPPPRKESPPKPNPSAPETPANPAAAARAYREQQAASKMPSLIEQIVAEARSALARMKLREAELFCKEALSRDRRCAAAYEILGDIQRARGRTDEAVAMYSYVLQLDRGNREVQEKFDRLNGVTRNAGAKRAAARAYAAAPAGRAAAPSRWMGALRSGALSAAGLAAIGYLAVAAAGLEGSAAASLVPLEWDPRLLFSMALAGAAAGMLLSATGGVEPLRDELLVKTRSPRGRTVPFGAVLVLLSFVWAYAALFLLLFVAILNEARIRSLGRAFLVAFAVAGAFAASRATEAAVLFLMGGNLVFPGLLAGWGLADAIRRGRR